MLQEMAQSSVERAGFEIQFRVRGQQAIIGKPPAEDIINCTRDKQHRTACKGERVNLSVDWDADCSLLRWRMMAAGLIRMRLNLTFWPPDYETTG
jgi:hypothetical protein